MIEPASIDLSVLPWLPLEARSAFPRQPAIYFAIDNQNKVQYIGRSVNPKGRWDRHHKYSELNEIGEIRIAYLFVQAPDLLPSIEKALIAWFKPALNRETVAAIEREKRRQRAYRAKDYRVKPGEWGESKQRVQIMLTPTAIERIDAVAEEMELTRAEVVERLIRSECLNPDILRDIRGGEA